MDRMNIWDRGEVIDVKIEVIYRDKRNVLKFKCELTGRRL